MPPMFFDTNLFARFKDCAVARLIKLIQDASKIITAIAMKAINIIKEWHTKCRHILYRYALLIKVGYDKFPLQPILYQDIYF